MKVRTGFVSNSSSSSFCIVGVTFNNEEAAPDISDTHLHMEYAISEDDWVVVGLPPDKMEDEETLLEFKQQIAAEFAKCNHEIDIGAISFITDGGYDG